MSLAWKTLCPGVLFRGPGLVVRRPADSFQQQPKMAPAGTERGRLEGEGMHKKHSGLSHVSVRCLIN